MAMTHHTLPLRDGETLEFVQVLPPDFDPEQTYPVLLALPPGGQNMTLVEACVEAYWEREALKRGWIVVSPAAPNGVLFFSGGQRYMPELMSSLLKQYKVECGKFHVAGISNGGRSAFRFAVDWPERFLSILALPGYPPDQRDYEHLDRLQAMRVSMYAGENDPAWVEAMRRTEQLLKSLDIPVSFEVVPGEGHVIHRLEADNTPLYDFLDSARC